MRCHSWRLYRRSEHAHHLDVNAVFALPRAKKRLTGMLCVTEQSEVMMRARRRVMRPMVKMAEAEYQSQTLGRQQSWKDQNVQIHPSLHRPTCQ